MPFQDQNLTPIKQSDLNLTPIQESDLFTQAATPASDSWFGSLWDSAKGLKESFDNSWLNQSFIPDSFNNIASSQAMRAIPGLNLFADIPPAQDIMTGASRIAGGLATPLNIGTAALSGGTSLAAKAGMGGLANVLNTGTKISSAPIAAHGAMNVVDPESSGLERITGGLELLGGGFGMRSKTPKFDDVLPPVKTADDLKGKWDVDESGKPFHVVDKSADPNFNQGMGDPELAGSVPYKKLADELTPIKETDLSVSSVPKASVIKIKKPTEEIIAKAEAEGYILDGVDEQNRVIMTLNSGQKITPSTIDTPVDNRTFREKHESAQIQAEKIARTPNKTGTMKVDDLIELENIENSPEGNVWKFDGIDAGRTAAIKEDIRINGIKEPLQITVSRNLSGPYKGIYVLDDGHHRLAVAKELGLNEVPVQITYTDIPGAKKSNLANTPIEQLGAKSNPISAKLPNDLKGAKPRFNIGTNSYTPEFESDLDKALFIISQKNPSKRDGDYLKFVTDTLGVDEQAAREMGKIVRTRIKAVVKGQEPGNVTIPASDNLTPPKPNANNLKPTVGDNFTDALKASANQPPGKIPPTIGQATGSVPEGPVVPPNATPEQASKLREAYELSRGLMSVDAPFLTSAAFRQAAPLVGTKNWFKAWDSAVKSFGSQKVYDDIIQKIESRPLFRKQIDGKGGEVPSYAEEIGLRMTYLTRGISKREEAIRSQWAEKIPVYGHYVRASNRAYTGFLDSLRADQLETLVNQAELQKLDPKNNLVLGRQIAEVINDATGRSSLKQTVPFTKGKEVSLEQHSKLLTDALWSPRLLNRKLRMLNPANYANVDPFVRQEMIKNLGRSAANWAAFSSLLSLAGGKITWDANNSDFGKIRFGDTRIDPGAGLLQLIVLAQRMAPEALGGGHTVSSTTGRVSEFGSTPFAKDRTQLVTDFATNQMHPTLRIAYDFGKATSENPVGLTDRTLQNFLPIFTQDLAKVMQDDPTLAKLLLGGAGGSIGLGTQTYGKGDFGKPVYVPNQWDLMVGR